MWKLQHPEGQREINELHVPVGAPVKLVMATEDVIHSFYVPAFRVKRTLFPGRYAQCGSPLQNLERFTCFAPNTVEISTRE